MTWAHPGVEPWGNDSSPPASSRQLIRHHELDYREQATALYAVECLREHRDHVFDHDSGGRWRGETADERVDALLPGASVRRRCHVLTVALRMAQEQGVSMSRVTYPSEQRDQEAA